MNRRRGDGPGRTDRGPDRPARPGRRRRRWIGCLVALAVANLGVQTAGLVAPMPADAPPELSRAAPLPAFEMPLPAPVPEPAAAPPVVAGSVIGHIEIPRLSIDVPLHQGIEMTVINRGPSHWPGTALPGQNGNVVVAGHRVTNTRPFRHIDTLEVGNEVIFTLDGVRYVYRVTGHEVVDDTAMWITEQTAEPTATLFACHPPGSAKYRWVTYLALDQTSSQPTSSSGASGSSA